MAETYRGKVSTLHKWTSDFQREFVRTGPLKRFMGTGGNAIIRVNDTDLKDDGDSVDFPFVSALRGRGVSGNTPLAGNEEEGKADSHRIFIDWRRNGTLLTRKEEKATKYDQFMAYKDALKAWAQEQIKYDSIAAFLSVGYEISTTSTSIFNHAWYNYGYPTSPETTLGSTGYAAATQLNNFASYNGPVTGSHNGRLLFGAATSNYSATWATALGNIDTTADKMTTDILDIAKDMAQDDRLNPRIYPYTGDATRFTDETYVCFMHPTAFTQFRKSLSTDLAYAETRGRDNPLFAAGDLMWNGILVTALPGLPVLSGGASTSYICPSFFCGKGALGFAWGQLPKAVEDMTDYGFRNGIGIEMQYGAEKLLYTDTSTGHKVQQFISIFTSAGY